MLKRLIKIYALIVLALAVGTAGSVNAQTNQEKLEGYVPLFDTKDLSQWDGDMRLWTIEDGVIVGQTDDKDRHIDANTFLIYKGDVPGDFTLRFDIRLSEDGNSGVQYRSFRMEDEANPYKVGGYQADFDGHAEYSGMNYGENFRWTMGERSRINRIEAGRKITTMVIFASDEDLKKKIKVADWNTYEIVAFGYTFIHRINGELMSILIDDDKENRRADGILAIQMHAGSPMKVEVKNMRIRMFK